MGAWDTEPFGNDTAADFSGHLDDTPEAERAAAVRTVLEVVRDTPAEEYMDSYEGDRAVAAAALVASQCPGGDPFNEAYGPKEPLPVFPVEFRALAVAALDRVMAKNSETAELWDDTDHWRDGANRLRAVLAAATEPGEDGAPG
jgi:hypothetical protein